MINIIGGGPAGLYLAYLLAKKGREVNVIEEHKEIGKPVQCTGIATAHLKDFIEIKKEFLVNELDTSRVFSKNNQIEFKLKEKNIIIDRHKFDSYLAKKAVKAGVKLFLSHRFIRKEKNNIIIKDIKKNKIKKIETGILIGADGPLSKIARSINNRKTEFWIGAQARVKIKTDKNVFESYFGEVAPKFFAWVVPENDKIARLGLAAKNKTSYHFKRFLELKKIKNKDILEYQGGIIPLYNPNFRIQKEDVYLIGDAATQVKATTGGGLIPAFLSSKVLADCILKNKNYEKEFQKKVGKELDVSFKIRKVLNRFSEKDYDFLIELCNNKKVKNIIEQHDREFPSKFIIKLFFTEPRFAYFGKYLL